MKGIRGAVEVPMQLQMSGSEKGGHRERDGADQDGEDAPPSQSNSKQLRSHDVQPDHPRGRFGYHRPSASGLLVAVARRQADLTQWRLVKEPPSTEPSDNEPLAEQLERTAADLRLLGEHVGAVPAGSGKTYSIRRARVTFAIVVALAVLIGWLMWSHWHSLWVALAPLVWIFWRGWRFQRRTRSKGSPSTEL